MKKCFFIAAILLSAALPLSTKALFAATEMVGDVDGSGAVDIVDALLTAQYYVGLDPDNFNPEVADVDCSNTIEIVDALLVAKYYVGEIDNFPAVDLSTRKAFPPIGGPQGAGDCTCWSSAYYYNTFLQASDEGLDASGGDPNVVCSVRFLFGLIAQGHWGAECTRHAMQRLSDVGCPNEVSHPYGEDWNYDDYTRWPTEDAWLQALQNRTGSMYSLRVDSDDGIDALKQALASGRCAVTRGDFGANYAAYGNSAAGYGIDNHVMYTRDINSHGNRHSMCIIGYDDDISYVDDTNTTCYGAFLLANSEGSDWGWYNSTAAGTKGYLWLAYDMFKNREFGYYDWPDIDDSPCADNEPDPTAYYHDDRPQYRPLLYAVAGINHNKRNLLTFTGGIGSTGGPDFNGPMVIEQTQEGEIEIDDSKRVVIDLTDGAYLIEPGQSKQVFVQLSLDDSADSNATITSADFYYDHNGDGSYEVFHSTDTTVIVTPGSTEYATVQIYVQ